MANVFSYYKLLATSVKLINRFGVTCTITSYVDTPNPEGDWKAPVRTASTFACRGVFTKATAQHADGTLIHIGDQLVLVAGNTPASLANLNGEILRDGETQPWKVSTVVPVQPGDTVLLYKIKVTQ